MKILFILSFLMACNFLLRIFSRSKLGIYWDWIPGKIVGTILMISSLVYQLHYWFTKFGVI